MANKIRTIEDLMRASYHGTYALELLGMMPSLRKAGLGPNQTLGSGSLPHRMGQQIHDELLKADDPFLTTKDQYFNNIYGEAVTNWLNEESDVWKLLPKTTYQAKGDSVRVVTTEASNFYGQLETATALGDTDIPDLLEINYTDPAVMYNHWASSLIAQIKSTYQDTPRKNAAAYFRDYFARQHPKNINERLLYDVDTLARGGGNFDNYIESIDRVCSSQAEEALAGIDAGDADIYGLDRSTGNYDAYTDINGGVLRPLDLGLIDDMLANIKLFSETKNYILLTDEIQFNQLEALEAVKYRYGGEHKYKISAKNGVNTREGIAAGFSVATYRGGGLEVPIFTSQHVHAEAGGNGNIYALDLDHIEIRVAMPTMYLETGKSGFLLLDSFNYGYAYLTIAQLIADKFSCHGAIKYLN